MKWLLGLLFVVLVGVGVFFYPFFVIRENGRNRIYGIDEGNISRYPGYGIVSELVNEQLFVNPKDKPVFFDVVENKALYNGDKYEVTVI